MHKNTRNILGNPSTEGKKTQKSFVMKDLGAANKILGMRITRDKKNHKLTLSQGEYIEKVLERFRMLNA
jgi:hypothetical protein